MIINETPKYSPIVLLTAEECSYGDLFYVEGSLCIVQSSLLNGQYGKRFLRLSDSWLYSCRQTGIRIPSETKIELMNE